MQKAPEVIKASLCLKSIHYTTEKYVSIFYNSSCLFYCLYRHIHLYPFLF